MKDILRVISVDKTLDYNIDKDWFIEIPVTDAWANKPENKIYVHETAKQTYAMIDYNTIDRIYDDIKIDKTSLKDGMIKAFKTIGKIGLGLVGTVLVAKLGKSMFYDDDLLTSHVSDPNKETSWDKVKGGFKDFMSAKEQTPEELESIKHEIQGKKMGVTTHTALKDLGKTIGKGGAALNKFVGGDSESRVRKLRQDIKGLTNESISNLSFFNNMYKQYLMEDLISDLADTFINESSSFKKKLISESPLEVKRGSDTFKHSDDDAIMFYQIGNRVVLLNSKTLSKEFESKLDKDEKSDMLKNVKKNKDFDEDKKMVLSIFAQAYEDGLVTKKDFEEMSFKKLYKKYVKLSGRLWTKGEVISFWNYPDTYSQFENVISNINNKMNEYSFETIDFNSWDVEIPVKRGWSNKGENIQYMINSGKHEYDAIIPLRNLSEMYEDISFNDKTFSEEMMKGFKTFSKIALPIIAGIAVGRVGAYLASIVISKVKT